MPYCQRTKSLTRFLMLIVRCFNAAQDSKVVKQLVQTLRVSQWSDLKRLARRSRHKKRLKYMNDLAELKSLTQVAGTFDVSVKILRVSSLLW